jgi:hypothetical protein
MRLSRFLRDSLLGLRGQGIETHLELTGEGVTIGGVYMALGMRQNQRIG